MTPLHEVGDIVTLSGNDRWIVRDVGPGGDTVDVECTLGWQWAGETGERMTELSRRMNKVENAT